MNKLITHIKRLALALCFAMPCVSWAAVDYTGTDYEPWSYSAGCVVWRGTQNNFHESTIADVAADGTVGEEYTLNTSGHPWQVFASNQSSYTSPGLTLVFDASGYKADPDASFTPLSFGGLKVDALADETEGTPYSINGSSTAARYTDFGRTDVDTYFEFNKSFTVNRSSATRCFGAVTIQVAQGATFKSQASLWAEVGGTVKLTGEGTVELPSGLYVNNNSTSTLDLSAATRPTIAGNVTIYEGGAIALPAGTEPSEETPFTVCSGTLTVSTYNYVKIGDADPITATLTVSGGAITGIEPYSLERTFTSDYPTVVPAGAVFTFQGGTEDEPVVLDARTVNGTLKTEGYFSFTSYAASASSTLEVVSGKVTLDPGNNWFRGTLTIDADAEFVNASTDAVQYGGTFTANVHGTLNMGSTRWSLGSNNTINLYEGCTVTGSGQGGNGALDWIESATANLNVTGPVTITAPIRIRSGATVNVTVDSDANAGLTLGTTIGVGTIVKKGAGLIKFTTNPLYAITCQNGAFTFGVDATPTITYTAKPSNSTSMWYAKQSTWKGTVVIPAIAAGNTSTQILLENWGNANSSLTLNGISGNTWLTSNVTVPAAVTVAGDVGFSNGSKGNTYTFSKIAGGTGNLTFQAWANNASATYAITVLDADNYSGTIVIPSSNADQMTVKLGNIVKTGAEAGDKLVAISNGGGTFDISTATLNGETADLEVKSDGIYVAEENIDVTVPVVDNTVVTVTVGGETVSPKTEGGNVYAVAPGSVVTVTYAAADGYEISGTTVYTVDTAIATTFEITDTATAQYVAQIRTGATTYEKYTTLADALDSANIAYGITLLADVTETAVVVDSAVIISGNYTINSDVTIADGGSLQLMLATLNGTLTIQGGGTYVTLGGTLGNVVAQDGGIINLTTLSEDAAPLTVSSLTLKGALTIVSSYGLAERGTTYKAISYVTENATIAEGASFEGSNEWSATTTVDGDDTVVCLEITKVAVVDGVYYDTAQEAVEAAVASGNQAEFLVQPGTVTLGAGETLVVKGGYQPTVELDAGLAAPQYEVKSTYDSETFIYTYVVKSYVAQIGDTKYESLADAVDAATSGQTVKLLADVTLATRVEPNLGNGTTLTIDLNDFTITPTVTCGNGSAFDVKSGNVTIKNGAINGSAITTIECDPITARSGSDVTLEDLEITICSQNGACVYPFDGATVTIKSGTYVNETEDVYQYGRFNTAELKGMAVNQANVADQLITIEGGSFSQIDPKLGDDSWTEGAGTFLAEGKTTKLESGMYVVVDDMQTVFDGGDGSTFTIADPGSITIPEGKSLTDSASDSLTYAQAWVLGLLNETTGELTADLAATIEVTGGKVVVKINGEPKDGYLVTLKVFEKATLAAEWPAEPTKTYSFANATTTDAKFTAGDAGFYKVAVKISNALMD